LSQAVRAENDCRVVNGVRSFCHVLRADSRLN